MIPLLLLEWLARYVIGCFITAVVVFLTNLWLREHAWTPKVLTWMVILWPLTAVVLGFSFIIIGIVRLATFICERPKSNIGRCIKDTIQRSTDAVMEPLVNRIVK